MKRVLRGILQLAVLVVPALAVYAWQAHDMLPATAGQRAPDFELPRLGGATLGRDALEGQPAVLYFFAPWCGVCAASAPQLRWFDRLAGRSARVVLVAMDYDDAAQVEDYARRHSLAMPVLLGDPAMGAAYRIRGYPTYYVLDAAGRVVARDIGFSTVAGLWWRTLGPGR